MILSGMSYEERETAVRELLAMKKSNGDIAVILGAHSRNVICGWINRHLIHRPKLTAGGKAQVNRHNARMAGERRRLAKAAGAPGHHPRPKPAQKPTVSHSLPTEGLVRFLDSRRGQCKFSFWDDTRNWKPDRVETVMVCGRPVEGEGSYCPAHRRLCFDARLTAASSRPFRHAALELA